MPNMVGVFVGDEYAINVLEGQVRHQKATAEFSHAQTTIHQQS
jgi:hypothetical protein